VQPIGQSHRGHAGRIERTDRQIQYQEIDRSILKKHRGHGQRFLERSRCDHDQPFELDAPGHGFDRVKASSQVQVRGYPARGLSLGDCPQRQSRLATRLAAVKGGGRNAWQAAQAEDRIKLAETGRDRPLVERFCEAGGLEAVVRNWLRGDSQSSDHLPFPVRPAGRTSVRLAGRTPTRSCPSPAFPKGRQSSLDIRGGGSHGT
jgi:hypothetical protein